MQFIALVLMASSSSAQPLLSPQIQPTVLTATSWSVVNSEDRTACSQTDLLLSSQWVSLVHDINGSLLPKPIELPWNRKNFLDGHMFSHSNHRTTLPVIVPAALSFGSCIPSTSVDPPSHAWQSVSRRLTSVRDSSTQDSLRSYAIEKWKVIIQIAPKFSETGRVLMKGIWDLNDDSQLFTTLNDVFSSKATATILKRANSFSR